MHNASLVGSKTTLGDGISSHPEGMHMFWNAYAFNVRQRSIPLVTYQKRSIPLVFPSEKKKYSVSARSQGHKKYYKILH